MRRAAIIACGALLVAGSAGLGLAALRERAEPTGLPAAVPAGGHQGPIYGYGPFPDERPPDRPPLALDQVRDALATAYYRHVSPQLLVQPTIPEILEGLGDPYTEYLEPARFAQLQDRLGGSYHGVGLSVSPAENGLIVTSSLSGPAREAGIRPGDVIVAIDGKRTAAMGFERAVSLIVGEEGSVVELEVHRPGEQEGMAFTVVRRSIPQPIVKARVMKTAGHRIGHVRLLSFSEHAAERLERATRRLTEEGAEALILDLRANPGGLLAQAIRVTSLFLESGVVCSTEGVNQESRMFRVSGAPIETELPIAVLVDDHTASAAELVAAALRDNKRAVLVGARTYGKATVQSLFPLSNGAALRLTTSSYRTPAGRGIGGKGLKPKFRAFDDPATRPDEGVVVAARVIVERLASATG